MHILGMILSFRLNYLRKYRLLPRRVLDRTFFLPLLSAFDSFPGSVKVIARSSYDSELSLFKACPDRERVARCISRKVAEFPYYSYGEQSSRGRPFHSSLPKTISPSRSRLRKKGKEKYVFAESF